MKDVRIISGWIDEDGRKTGDRDAWRRRVDDRTYATAQLSIRSLADGWKPDTDREFGSGAGPIWAVERALELLNDPSDETQIVVITGDEPLASGYDRDERRRLMEIYDGVSIPEGYDRVAHRFIDDHEMTRDEFLAASRLLEHNCRLAAEARGLEVDPPGTHDTFVTDLFRRVDCAHPQIDFAGELVLATSAVADELGLTGPRIVACETAEVVDGPSNVDEIARFEHVRTVIERIADDLGGLPNPVSDDVHLELYTCFPVVPLAFIEAAEWAAPADIASFLQTVPIAISGGMNFARAPWNNPALRGLVLVARRVAESGGVGIIHGNGGLGAKQGVCVIERNR